MSSPTVNPDDDFFGQLKAKVITRLKEEVFDERLARRVQEVYSSALSREPVVLTRQEKRRLMQAALQEIVDELLADV